jgi:hypothetical protein
MSISRDHCLDDSGDGDADVSVSDRGIRDWIYRQIGQHVARFDRVHRSDRKPVLAEAVTDSLADSAVSPGHQGQSRRY